MRNKLANKQGRRMLVSKPRFKQSGFTLTELMVAVAVIGILASIAAPSYNAFIANTKIRTTAESVINGLQLARAEAIKRNLAVTFTLNNDSSWSVIGGGVVIQENSSKEGADNKISIVKTGGNILVFTALGTATAGQLTRVDIDSTAVASANTKELRVTVGVGGNARMCDPNITDVNNPKKC